MARLHARGSQARVNGILAPASAGVDIASGTVDLYFYDAANKTSTKLNPAPAEFCNVQLSSDGTKVLISAEDVSTGYCQIYLADAKYKTFTKLTNDASVHGDASLSADGKTIIYDDGTHNDATLYTVPAAGGTPTKLTFTSVETAWAPVFTPDGKKILFTGYDGTSFYVYMANADGTGLTQLTRVPSDEEPAVSPDGTQVAFARYSEDAPTIDIYIVSIGGETNSNPAKILTTDASVSGMSHYPMFTSSGKLLFLSYKPNRDNDNLNDNIFEINTDGTGLTQITSTTYETCFNWWSWWDF